MTEDIEEFVDTIQSEIVSCPSCEPYDNEEKEIYWVHGAESWLGELFAEHGVPEQFHDALPKLLSCPNCGLEFDSPIDTVGVKPIWEKEIETYLDNQSEKWYQKIHPQLIKFRNFMEEFPYLGASHPFGKKIIDGLSQFPKAGLSNTAWYRARTIEDGRSFTNKDMEPPAQNIIAIKEGRFNHFGQSHWYLANNTNAAGIELLVFDENQKYYWVQKINIIKAQNILDLRAISWDKVDQKLPLLALGLLFISVKSDVINANVNRQNNWKPEYFIPRFIADVAKNQGFSGILFNSNHHHSDNLVIFDYKSIESEFIDEPNIHKLEEMRYSFEFDEETKKYLSELLGFEDE